MKPLFIMNWNIYYSYFQFQQRVVWKKEHFEMQLNHNYCKVVCSWSGSCANKNGCFCVQYVNIAFKVKKKWELLNKVSFVGNILMSLCNWKTKLNITIVLWILDRIDTCSVWSLKHWNSYKACHVRVCCLFQNKFWMVFWV